MAEQKPQTGKPEEPQSDATASTKTPEEIQAVEQREKLNAFNDAQLFQLETAGYHSYEDVAALSDDELRAVPGIGEGTLKSWREQVPAPEAAPAEEWPEGLSKDTCPVCHVPVDKYEGENPQKIGTGWCPTHGRVRLD